MNELTQSEIAVTPANMILNPQAMQQITGFAQLMAQGSCTVPKHLQGSAADCLAITMQAARWNMDPFAVAQKTHLVNGTLGYEAQLINAVIVANAPTTERLRFDWFGDWNNYIAKKLDKNLETGLGVKVWATFKGESEPRVLEVLLSPITVRNSPLWKADPRQQIAYLGIKRWSRLYCPEVIMGVYTADELEDSAPAPEREINPDPELVTEYPQDQFDKNFPKWEKAIQSGKLTADDVISKASSKYPLSNEQLELIKGIK